MKKSLSFPHVMVTLLYMTKLLKTCKFICAKPSAYSFAGLVFTFLKVVLFDSSLHLHLGPHADTFGLGTRFQTASMIPITNRADSDPVDLSAAFGTDSHTILLSHFWLAFLASLVLNSHSFSPTFPTEHSLSP